VSAFVDGEAKNGRLIAAGLNNDKRQRLLRLYSRTDVDAANEFPGLAGTTKPCITNGGDRTPQTKKASLSLAFSFVPAPLIPAKLFAQLAGGIQVFEPKPYILVGGASFELATPAV
jgi:hypothetical protein